VKRLFVGFVLMTIPIIATAQNPAPQVAPAPQGAAVNAAPPAPAATIITPANAPKIKFTSVKWNFGKVSEGPEVKKLFRFTNLGKSPLRIERVQPSCGCTGAEAEGRNEIPPGEMGAIRVTYNTKDRPGHAIKTVTVVTNDPMNQNVVLTFEVDVVRDIEIMPAQASFYGVKKGQSRDLQVKVLGKENIPFGVLSARSSNGTVAVTMAALREGARRGATIGVSLPGDKPIGTINDEIILATSSKNKPEVRIPVIGEIVGRVQVYPKQAYLNGPTGQSTLLQVTADPAEGFKVRNAKTTKHKVNAKVKKSATPEGKTTWQVEISVPWLSKEGPIEDEVVITTNDPEQPTFKIPVNGSKTKPVLKPPKS